MSITSQQTYLEKPPQLTGTEKKKRKPVSCYNQDVSRTGLSPEQVFGEVWEKNESNRMITTDHVPTG